MNTDRLTLRERLRNIWNDWTAPLREIRRTAIGWNPGGWVEDCGPTASGEREFYVVVREAKVSEHEN